MKFRWNVAANYAKLVLSTRKSSGHPPSLNIEYFVIDIAEISATGLAISETDLERIISNAIAYMSFVGYLGAFLPVSGGVCRA